MEVLLNTCKEACDEMTPFIEAVYAQLNKNPDAAVLKADKSFFSLADGVVQARAQPPIEARTHQPPRSGGRNTNTFDERC